MSIRDYVVLATLTLSLSAAQPPTAIASAAEEGATKAEICQEDLKPIAAERFDRLFEFNGKGWRDFDVKDIELSLRNIQQSNRHVALLINDIGVRGGQRLVYGYIYKITQREVRRVSTEHLTPQERRELTWRNLWQSRARLTFTEWTLHLTTTPPRFEEGENGTQKSHGWDRQPSPRTMTSIKLEDVIAGKFEI